MKQNVTFSYFYGDEADMLTFYRIPKLLFTSEVFKALTTDAKVLYGLMLDRMTLSMKNKWFDPENRAYIYFSLEDVMELLNCKKNKAVKTIQELDGENGMGLIEKKRQGQGKPTIFYVKNFIINDSEVGKTNFKTSTKRDSGSLQDKHLEVDKKATNKNDINNTELSNTESNHIISLNDEIRRDDRTDMQAYSEIIKENLDLDILYERYPFDKEFLEGIYNLILETVLCKGRTIIIASNEYSTELVKGKFLKLNSSHIEYVMGCMQSNTTKVKNIKKYLLASLFNAPATISGYYRVEVNFDMPQYARTN